MKKVFIIVGTARSGSTLLNLMIGNGDKGFSVGELINIMRPNSSDELIKNGDCFCSDPACNFWKDISQAGEKHVYSKIFERCSHVDFIVDSSKRHLWLKDQIEYSKNKNYKVIPILTYKTPLEFAYSKAKRDNLSGWKKGWTKEYQVLFGMLNDFISVKYRELARDPAGKLKSLCRKVDIPYFDGKENFWNNDSRHFLFGSNTVKKSNKLIYYDKQYDKDKLANLKDKLRLDDQTLRDIMKVLDAFEVGQKRPISNSIYSLKSKLGRVPHLSNLVYRVQATPYYAVNKPMHELTKSLLRLRKRLSSSS